MLDGRLATVPSELSDYRIAYLPSLPQVLKKSDVAARKNSSHVRAEKDILASTSSAHVVKLFYSFQSRTHLYLVCRTAALICLSSV